MHPNVHHRSGRARRRRGLVPTLLAVAAVLLVAAPAGARMGTLVVVRSMTLTEGHQGAIVIDADGVTLDCAGHQVTGSGVGPGVGIQAHTGVTVKNCRVSGFEVGYAMWHSMGNRLDHDFATGNLRDGFVVSDSSDNRIVASTAEGNGGTGFALQGSSHANTLTDDTSSRNAEGFGLNDDVVGNVFARNVVHDNRDNGFGIWSGHHNTFADNVSSGSRTGSEFAVSTSDDNTFEGNRASGSGHNGFWIAGGASGNTFLANVATSNHDNGFAIWTRSDSNVLIENLAADNATGSGFVVYGAQDNTLLENTVVGGGSGFWVGASATGNTIRGNEATGSAGDAYRLEDAHHNTLTQNVAGAYGGRGFALRHSWFNTVSANSAAGGPTGFEVWAASSHNSLQGNTAVRNVTGFWLHDAGTNWNTFVTDRASNNAYNGFAASSGDHNTWRNDIANGNAAGNGFALYDGAWHSTVSGCVARRNGQFDALDTNPRAASNVWKRNSFGRTSPPGLGR